MKNLKLQVRNCIKKNVARGLGNCKATLKVRLAAQWQVECTYLKAFLFNQKHCNSIAQEM